MNRGDFRFNDDINYQSVVFNFFWAIIIQVICRRADVPLSKDTTTTKLTADYCQNDQAKLW